jgi:hypothetical protein
MLDFQFLIPRSEFIFEVGERFDTLGRLFDKANGINESDFEG